MRDVIYFTSTSGLTYEVRIICDDHDLHEKIPLILIERESGEVEDCEGNVFGSLMELSHMYKFEVISFASDVGD